MSKRLHSRSKHHDHKLLSERTFVLIFALASSPSLLLPLQRSFYIYQFLPLFTHASHSNHMYYVAMVLRSCENSYEKWLKLKNVAFNGIYIDAAIIVRAFILHHVLVRWVATIACVLFSFSRRNCISHASHKHQHESKTDVLKPCKLSLRSWIDCLIYSNSYLSNGGFFCWCSFFKGIHYLLI